MSALSLRIRKARRLASITQNELAHRIGVKRSAVTQWENANGTKPNVEHLIRIAIEAGVSFEWIATGRGAGECPAELIQAVVIDDYAMDALESKALGYLREMTSSKMRIALQVLEVLSR